VLDKDNCGQAMWEAGQNGYELVAVYPDSEFPKSVILFFKRPAK
jgi:hypothetical protein